MANKTTANIPDIFAYVADMAGYMNALGVGPAQTIGLGTLMRESNIEPEMGSSAMQRLLLMMGTQREKLAGVIGADPRKFESAFRSNPLDALGMVMGGRSERQDNVEVVDFLRNELGFKNVRDIRLFTQLGPRWKRLGELTKIAAGEMNSSESLDRAEQEMGTTLNASFTKLGNAVNAAAEAIGTEFAPAVKMAADGLAAVIGAIPSAIHNSGNAIGWLNPNARENFVQRFDEQGRPIDADFWKRVGQQGRDNALRMRHNRVDWAGAIPGWQAANIDAPDARGDMQGDRLRGLLAGIPGPMGDLLGGVGEAAGVMRRNLVGNAARAIDRMPLMDEPGRIAASMIDTASLGTTTALEALNTEANPQVREQKLTNEILGDMRDALNASAAAALNGFGIILQGGE